jgi:hypothetical protein
MKSGRKRGIALLIVGMVLGALLIAPAGAHISSVKHTWKKHFLPLAKKAFYTEKESNSRFDAQKARLGKTETGMYSFVGTDGSGYTGTTIEFDQMLPAAIAAGNGHYVTTPTAQCPGPGRAAAGHLCVYEGFRGNATFYDIFSPTDTLTTSEDASRQGAMIVFSITGATPNGRGTWAVTPAAASVTSSGAGSAPAVGSPFAD